MAWSEPLSCTSQYFRKTRSALFTVRDAAGVAVAEALGKTDQAERVGFMGEVFVDVGPTRLQTVAAQILIYREAFRLAGELGIVTSHVEVRGDAGRLVELAFGRSDAKDGAATIIAPMHELRSALLERTTDKGEIRNRDG